MTDETQAAAAIEAVAEIAAAVVETENQETETAHAVTEAVLAAQMESHREQRLIALETSFNSAIDAMRQEVTECRNLQSQLQTTIAELTSRLPPTVTIVETPTEMLEPLTSEILPPNPDSHEPSESISDASPSAMLEPEPPRKKRKSFF
jgi:hypothetical protein